MIDTYPDLLESMSIGTVSWLKPRPNIEPTHVKATASAQKTSVSQYLANNWVTLLFLATYLVVNGYFFRNAVQTYATAGANMSVQIARGCGAMLNFNGALILIR